MAGWEVEGALYSVLLLFGDSEPTTDTEGCREMLGTVRDLDFATGLKTGPPFSDILLMHISVAGPK